MPQAFSGARSGSANHGSIVPGPARARWLRRFWRSQAALDSPARKQALYGPPAAAIRAGLELKSGFGPFRSDFARSRGSRGRQLENRASRSPRQSAGQGVILNLNRSQGPADTRPPLSVSMRLYPHSRHASVLVISASSSAKLSLMSSMSVNSCRQFPGILFSLLFHIERLYYLDYTEDAGNRNRSRLRQCRGRLVAGPGAPENSPQVAGLVSDPGPVSSFQECRTRAL